MGTYTAKKAEISKKWLVVDGQDLVLGRMASEIAKVLRGKHKTTFTPHMDCGDNVIIINAEKIHLTGKKTSDKKYYRHTGYPGGIRETDAGKILEGRFPQRVVKKAIERMISRNPLGRQQMKNLYVYAGSQHPHEAQNPTLWDIGAQNNKNVKDRKQVKESK